VRMGPMGWLGKVESEPLPYVRLRQTTSESTKREICAFDELPIVCGRPHSKDGRDGMKQRM
jgi:hypothetical protein